MRPRSVLVAIALLSLVAAAPAANAKAKPKPKPKPKPVCMLLTDPAGDSNWDLAPVIAPSTLDIISGDMATGAKQMVAVLRLTSTDFANDPYSRLGYEWDFAASTTNGHSFSFNAKRALVTGAMSGSVSVDSKPLPSTADKFAIVGNTFVWTLTRSAAPELSRPNLVFQLFRAGSSMESATADFVDVAKTKYIDHQPSCVKAS